MKGLPNIQEDLNGFYFVLDGVTYGYWYTHAMARAGRDTEMRRRAAKEAKHAENN